MSTPPDIRDRVAPSRNGKPKPRRWKNGFAEFNCLIDQHLASMKPTEAIVWMVIWRHTDRKSGKATLSYDRIGTAVGLKRRATINAVAALVEAGFLHVVTRGGPDHSANVYRPTLPPN